MRRYAFRFQAGHVRKSGEAACEKDRLRTILIRDEQYLGLDHEPGFPQPGCHLVRPAAVDVGPHRVASIALRLQPRLVASMKHELERSARAQCAVEVLEDGGHLVVGDVDQRLPGEQASRKADPPLRAFCRLRGGSRWHCYAPSTGLEPVTPASGGQCSIR